MRCPVCDHDNRLSAKFCKKCGAALLQTPQSVPKATSPQPDPQPTVTPAPSRSEDPTHYTAEINRRHPACFIFLIDQSASMRDRMAGSKPKQSKADGVADQINRLLAELIAQNSLDAEIIDRVYVSVIGYGARVGPAFGGALADRDLLPISEVAVNYASLSRSGSFPVWFEPVAEGGTPMGSAMRQAIDVASRWVAEHPTDMDFPPIVMNITDGEANQDDQPDGHARRLTDLATGNGNILLFNLHLSEDSGNPVMFPDSPDRLNARFAMQLFALSSVLPPPMRRLAANEGFGEITGNSRGFVYNADMTALIKFIDIGTRPNPGALR
jgi:uncharacterized protein YegL